MVDYVSATEKACMEIYGGRSKRQCHQYSVIGIQFESEDPPSEG